MYVQYLSAHRGVSLLDSGTGTQLPVLWQQPHREHTHHLCQCTMERAAVVSGRRSPSVPEYNISTSTLSFDQHFTTTAEGILLLAEIVSVKMDFKY